MPAARSERPLAEMSKAPVILAGRTIAKLVDEVEALCRVYDGRDAESEQWYQTCERLERLDKLVKRIRIQQRAAQPLTSCRRAPAGSTM